LHFELILWLCDGGKEAEMNHWTDEQMSAWVLGERNVAMAEHLAACDECRRELAKLQGALAGYRNDVQQSVAADDYRWVRIRAGVASRAEHGSRGLRWALTSGLALLALSLGLLVTPHRNAVPPVVPVQMSDEQLLNEIQDDLSRSAPEALAPAETLQQERAAVLAQSQSDRRDR
jgi:hypothetical protein